MNETKVRYALKARYHTADIFNEEAIDAFAENLAEVFEDCMVCLDYDTACTGVKIGVINVEIIVEADETYRVPAFPMYVRGEDTFIHFVLDEDSCEAATL